MMKIRMTKKIKRIKKKKFTENVNKKENIILKAYNEKLDLLKINS